MAYSVWWCLAWCFGLKSAVPFHAANLLLHACNAVLVFMLLQRLLREHFTGRKIEMRSGAGRMSVCTASDAGRSRLLDFRVQ